MKTALINGKIVLPYKIIENGYVVMKDGIIHKVGEGAFSCQCTDVTITDVAGKYIAPGFIDQHIHGAYGYDTMDATLEQFEIMRKGLLAEGTTSFLATTMTETDANILAALAVIKESMESVSEGAHMIGVHQEGPFISKKWKGAQREDAIAPGSEEKMQLFMEASNDAIRLITYAPENTTTAFTAFLAANNIVASIGHTDANFADVEAHVAAGLSNLTHFHNAMTPHHHREPGVVTAGFYFNELKAELIVDGIHLHPEVVRTTYKIKGSDGIILITDAMRAKGMEDGIYDLGGQDVHKKGTEARLADGTLAGSVVLMNAAVRNMIQFSGCTLVEAVKMATYNPANHLGFASKGRIAKDADADIIVFDENITIEQVYVAGIKRI